MRMIGLLLWPYRNLFQYRPTPFLIGTDQRREPVQSRSIAYDALDFHMFSAVQWQVCV